MDQNPFEQSIDQTRLDRLRGEILSFVSDFDQQGYDNLEIARALIWAAYNRANRADYIANKSFLQFVRDNADQAMNLASGLVRSFAKKNETNKIN